MTVLRFVDLGVDEKKLKRLTGVDVVIDKPQVFFDVTVVDRGNEEIDTKEALESLGYEFVEKDPSSPL